MIMKKLTLIILVISFIQTIHAQEDTVQNKYVLAGSMNFFIQNNTYPLSGLSINSGFGGIYSNSLDDTKNTFFAITPSIGKEINPKWMFGIQLDYRISKYRADNILVVGQSNSVDLQRNSNQIGAGIFSRFTLNPDNKFNLYFQPYIAYNLAQEEENQNSSITQEEKAYFVELGIDVGILYNISERMRATLRIGGLNYVKGKWEIVDSDTEKEFSSLGTRVNLATIYFGFEFRL